MSFPQWPLSPYVGDARPDHGDDPARADAFNAMERRRDPSTVQFRTFAYLRGLFVAAGLSEPIVRTFRVPDLAADLVDASVPEEGDRAGLLALIEASVEGDALGMEACRSAEGIKVVYPSAVLSATKPG